jgi:predicted transcriptional regulator
MDQINASHLITDEYSAKILLATFRRPKNAIELSQRLGIPIAACYRRIRALERANLIQCVERQLTQKGKRISVYISNLKNAYISIEEGQMKVRFDMKNGSSEEFGGIWDPMVSSEDQRVENFLTQ